MTGLANMVGSLDEAAALTWGRAQIDDVQERRLLDVCRYAYDRSSHIRSVWDAAGLRPEDLESRADFIARAPFLTAEDVRAPSSTADDPFLGFLCVPLEEVSVIGTTSGTSGLPQALPQRDGDIRVQAGLREAITNQVRAGSTVLVSGNPTRSGHGSGRYAALGAAPIFLDWDTAQVGQLIAAMREFRPTHWSVVSHPLVIALEQYAMEHNLNLAEAFASVEVVTWGGEPLGSATRAAIEAWGVSVRIMTSLGNLCPAVECPAQDGCHVWEDLAFVECLDPVTGHQVPDGERGELVVTALADQVAPVIRYRSGDLVRFTKERCACGLEHGRIWTVGRLDDRVFIGDRCIMPSDVWGVVEAVPATEAAVFQIVRSKSTEAVAHVRVGYQGALGSSALFDLRAELGERLAFATGVAFDVELQTVPALLDSRKGVKLKRVIDE